MPIRILIIKRGVVRLNSQAAALRHRVAGIDGEIDNGVLQLPRVKPRPPQAAALHHFELDVLADAAPEKIIHTPNQSVGVDYSRGERLLSRKSKEPLNQRRGARSAVRRTIDKAHDVVIAFGEPALHHPQAAQNYG